MKGAKIDDEHGHKYAGHTACKLLLQATPRIYMLTNLPREQIQAPQMKALSQPIFLSRHIILASVSLSTFLST